MPNDVILTGCAFHRLQQYSARYKYLVCRPRISRMARIVCSLQYLPSREIVAAFFHHQNHPTTERLQKELPYIEQNWIGSSIRPPSSLSVFDLTIRTNNDILRDGTEGCIAVLAERACYHFMCG